MRLFALLIFLLLTAPVSAQVKIGQIAPDISLPDNHDSIIQLSSLKGKVVLVDFWASWCGPCRAAIPAVNKLYDKYRAQGLVILGVSIDEKKTAWLKAIQSAHMKYIQVNDQGGWNAKSAAAYGVNEIPSTFLINKSGEIVAVDLEGKNLESNIKELLLQ